MFAIPNQPCDDEGTICFTICLFNRPDMFVHWAGLRRAQGTQNVSLTLQSPGDVLGMFHGMFPDLKDTTVSRYVSGMFHDMFVH
jgi:hypothetical protein